MERRRREEGKDVNPRRRESNAVEVPFLYERDRRFLEEDIKADEGTEVAEWRLEGGVVDHLGRVVADELQVERVVFAVSGNEEPTRVEGEVCVVLVAAVVGTVCVVGSATRLHTAHVGDKVQLVLPRHTA